MSVIIDTPIWSLGLRRRARQLSEQDLRLVQLWNRLVAENEAVLLDPVRQEVLSGVRDDHVFERLRSTLRGFTTIALTADDYEEAARCANACRAAGIAGSTVDFLLCGVARRRSMQLLTTDRDFTRYMRVVPIRLIEAVEAGE